MCPSEIIQCPHCESSRSRSDHLSHITECPQLDIPCPHAEFGCLWNNKRQELEDHIVSCPYESVKHYLYKQQQNENVLKADIQQLYRENETLKQRQADSQIVIDSITRRLDRITPMSETLRDEAIRSENERLANEVDNLSSKIVALELKQNMAIMNETFRLQEEIQTLKSSCFNLRMQMHLVVMKIESTLGSTVVVSNNSGSNDNSSSSAEIKLRTWLGKNKEKK